jgi:hypothetical protein
MKYPTAASNPKRGEGEEEGKLGRISCASWWKEKYSFT